MGSIPIRSKLARVAQLVEAPVLETVGWGFKSLYGQKVKVFTGIAQRQSGR